MKSNPKGYVSFVLHAHLPFVHHPESEDYLEEQWLFEAISETYITLLLNFGKLEKEHVDFRITMPEDFDESKLGFTSGTKGSVRKLKC